MHELTKTGIYKLKIKDRIYIGQTRVSFKTRFGRHIRDLNTARHENIHMQRIADQGYSPDFEILELIDRAQPAEHYCAREKYYIDLSDKNVLLNMILDPTTNKKTEEQKKAISELQFKKRYPTGDLSSPVYTDAEKLYYGTLNGEGNPFYGKKHMDESKEKMRQAKLGRKLSEEHKQNIGKAGEGRVQTKEWVEKRVKAIKDNIEKNGLSEKQTRHLDALKEQNKGREVSTMHKEKLSQIHTGEGNPFYGKNHTEETKQKMVESQNKEEVRKAKSDRAKKQWEEAKKRGLKKLGSGGTN